MKPKIYKKGIYWFVANKPVGFLRLSAGFLTWKDAIEYALRPKKWYHQIFG